MSNNYKLDLLLLNLTNLPERPVYSYGFVQVSALARRAKLSVVRWDGLGLTGQQQRTHITQLLMQYQPHAVGFTIRQVDSTVASDYININTGLAYKQAWFPLENVRAAIAHIRSISDTVIVVGGLSFSVAPQMAMEYLQPDFGIVGEPDDFIAHFDEVLEGKYEQIANLIYRRHGRWTQNERVFFGPLLDIEYDDTIVNDIFRFHGQHTLQATHLKDFPSLGTTDDAGHTIAIEIARGCPFACTYCCEPHVKGKQVRVRPLDVIEREIHNLLRHGLRYYWFICSELNNSKTSKQHSLALAERIIEINKTLPLPIVWRTYFLPIKFTKAELRLLLRSGLRVEQNGPFTALDDRSLKLMREPYRVKHVVNHIQALMELDQEPEFVYRKMPRWILWSWLLHPYATLESIRETLEHFSRALFDLKYDVAEGNPAMRVYEPLLSTLPEVVKHNTIILTHDDAIEKSVLHPSFFYSQALLEHFGDVVALHRFLDYAHDTLLSRRYRLHRNWLKFAHNLGQKILLTLCQDLQKHDIRLLTLPDWIEHPDIGNLHPNLWQNAAYQLLQKEENELKEFLDFSHSNEILTEQAAKNNAIIACLLASAFVIHKDEMQPLFEKLTLPLDDKGLPPLSPYRILALLISQYPNEKQLLDTVSKVYNARQLALLRYYLYALNIRLEPTLQFLALNSDNST